MFVVVPAVQVVGQVAEQEPQAVPVPLHVCEPVIALPVGQVYEQDCVLLGAQTSAVHPYVVGFALTIDSVIAGAL